MLKGVCILMLYIISCTVVAHDKYYLLPEEVVPESYDLNLAIYLDEEKDHERFSFTGDVKIQFSVTESVSSISLHQQWLDIPQDKVIVKANSKNIGVNTVSYDEVLLIVTFYLNDSVPIGKHSIYLEFSGLISLDDENLGLYVSRYFTKQGPKWLCLTQFQTVYARRAFPCFDEPALKAKFTLSISRGSNYMAVSNTERISSVPVPGSRLIKDTFATTPIMSSYLVEFSVFDLKSISDAGSKTNVYAAENAIDYVKYALEISPKLMSKIEEYMGSSYASLGISKMDLIAITEYDAGAMENWGFETFRDDALCYNPDLHDLTQKYYVASVIAHEHAHQWLGNLLTCKWWSQLWLNEGFATFFEITAPSWVDTVYDVDIIFMKKLRTAMFMDETKTHPMSMDPDTLDTPEASEDAFSKITYGKAGGVLRLMECTVGPEAWKTAIRSYISANKYSAVVQEDLFIQIEKVAQGGPNVTEMMKSWTEQAGHPLLSVDRSEKGVIRISQKPFGTHPAILSGSIWIIPISYTTRREANFEDCTPKCFMNGSTLEIKLDKQDENDWVIFNIRETGVYRMNYDKESLQQISTALKKENFDNIAPLNRGKIIHDLYEVASARENGVDFESYVNVLSYLRNEVSFPAWEAFDRVFSGVLRFAGISDKGVVQEYIRNITREPFAKLGLNQASSDTVSTISARAMVAKYACGAMLEECVEQAKQLFSEYMKTGRPGFSANYRETIIKTAIRHGGPEFWEFFESQPADQIFYYKSVEFALYSNNKYVIDRYVRKMMSRTGYKGGDKMANLRKIVEINPNAFFDYLAENIDDMNTYYICQTLPKISEYVTTVEQFMQIHSYLARGEIGKACGKSALKNAADLFQKQRSGGALISAIKNVMGYNSSPSNFVRLVIIIFGIIISLS